MKLIICSYTFFVKKDAPIVDFVDEANVPSQYLTDSAVLPTPKYIQILTNISRLL